MMSIADFLDIFKRILRCKELKVNVYRLF
jgi:hypothetical protein